jgi:hypothetical protein
MELVLSNPSYADMNQATQRWEDFEAEFYRDGSLRDIYVLDTQLQDWCAAANFIARRYRFEFTGGWQEAIFPRDIGQLFPTGPERQLTALSLDVSGVRVNCHFFTADEIEFDLDPAEVSDPSRLDGLFAFMKGLASAVGKDVLLTPENMREIAIFRCHPGADQMEHVPFGGFS